MKVFIIKSVLFITIILSAIFLSDTIGFFNPDYKDENKCWDYFYNYTERINIDILLLGNSHVRSGIETRYLSNILGLNAFIVSASGVPIIDTYFSLKESLARAKPKLVIIETYTLGRETSKIKKLRGDRLSNFLKSFASRKNLLIKLSLSPILFAIDDYPFAWSNTIRNHEFILNNFTQVERNIENWKKSKFVNNQSFKTLYLGTSTNPYTTGLEKDTVLKYIQKGSPLDGSKTLIDNEDVFYLEKIKKLCDDNHIYLMFLTIPVYYRHIKNYNIWENKYSAELSKFSKHWLNLQISENYNGFTEKSFGNTYQINQHLTFQGSITATYKLAEYIQKTYPNLLPYRKKDPVWLNMFYGEDGYFENNSPLDSDKQNSILLKNVQFENNKVIEADLLRKDRNYKLLIKISRENQNKEILKKSELIVTLEIIVYKSKRTINIRIPYDDLRTPENYAIFQKNIEPLKIIKIRNIKLISL